MKRGRITIHRRDEKTGRMIDQEVGGYFPETPGLGIHTTAGGKGWSVTHLASFLRVNKYPFALRVDAEDYAELLGGLEDWTQDGFTLQAIWGPETENYALLRQIENTVRNRERPPAVVVELPGPEDV